MMAEQVFNFIDGLLEKTKCGTLDWRPFSNFPNRKNIIEELINGQGGFDYGVNSIRENKSFYLQSGEGYVFLFDIYHGDPEVTSPSLDTIGLMVKINDVLPLDNIADYDMMQESLVELKLLIESYLEEKYCYPDVLYNFMNQVLRNE